MTEAPRGPGNEGDGRPGRRVAGWRADALFVAVAALLSLLFYRDFVFQPGRLLFGTDMLIEGFPLRGFALEEVRAGRGLPGWNPYLNGGHPYLATLPGPVFYPTSLLYLLLPLHRAIGWTFVLHTVLAAVFAYFCARSFRLSRPSSAVAGIAFMFSGYLLSTLYGGHDGRMFALVLMPLALAFLERGLRSAAPGWFLGLGSVVALQIFTPHTQMMYFSSLLLVLYAVFRIWTLWSEGSEGRRPPTNAPFRLRSGPARSGALVVLAFLIAAGLGAIQLLPTAMLLDHVVRAAAEEGYEFAASWSLPPQEVTALFLPDLVGMLQTYWGTNPFKLHTEYLGAVPVALAALAVAASFQRPPPAAAKAASMRKERRRALHAARSRRAAGGRGRGRDARGGGASDRSAGGGRGVGEGGRDPGIALERRLVWFLATVSLLGVLFALGAATPVHRLAYAVVPMMDGFRAPSMMVGPVSLFVALLAGAGWERIRSGCRPLPWLFVLAGSAPFLLLASAATLAPRGLLDFAYHSWFPAGWPRTPPPELEGALRLTGTFLLVGWLGVLGTARGLEVRRLGEWVLLPVLALLVLDLWRVDDRFLRTAEAEAELGADVTVRSLAARIGPGERSWPVEGVYHPNELMRHGMPVLTGTQKFLLEGYDRLLGGVGQENLVRYPALWALFDVRYLLGRTPLETPLLEPVDTPGPLVRVYEPAVRVPHAFFPAAVRAVEGPQEALRATLAISEPAATAVVEAPSAPPAGAGTATIERWRADEVILSVTVEEPGLLFVSELWAPGWRAELRGGEGTREFGEEGGDGGQGMDEIRELPILRTNVAFRGVQLPAGEHRLRLVYVAPGYRVGRAITLLTLLLLMGAFGWLAWHALDARREGAP